MKLSLISIFTLTSISAFAQQTCYVDLIDRHSRVVTTYTGLGDPESCQEGMKQCRKAVRLEPQLGGVDCIRGASQVAVPAPRPVVVPGPSRPQHQPQPQHIPAPHSCSFNLPCGQAYSRIQALQTLQLHGNSHLDAEGNLQIVIRATQNHGITLHEATEAFVRIQRQEGGSGSTTEARVAFSKVVSSLHLASLQELTETYLLVRLNENSHLDAMGNFQLVLSGASSSRRIRVSEAADSLIRLLRIEGGPNSTTEARNAFSVVTRNLHLAHLRELTDSYIELRRNENSPSDAVGNFELVLRATVHCGSIQVATQDFNSTLRMKGGANATAEARQSYRIIYGI